MGLLVDGQWHDQWYDTKSSNGEFIRTTAQFRNWITKDGTAGPSGKSGFQAESGRYHLYVSLACPWAHRTLIFRSLKNLQEHIDVSIVGTDMLDKGWTFNNDPQASFGIEVKDKLFNSEYYYQIYCMAKPTYSGRVTVPVLWDKKLNTIVSNESSEIIRMFNSAFDHLTGNKNDYYPEQIQHEIDQINNRVYEDINNGVYRSGFATTQQAYESAVTRLFDSLDWVENILSKQRYLLGSQITEADWRLFTTLLRFDPVYVGHFKCNIRRINDYPNLGNYVRELYQHPGIRETCNIDHCKRHYYYSHDTINPTRIIPRGPELHFDEAHDRNRFSNI